MNKIINVKAYFKKITNKKSPYIGVRTIWWSGTNFNYLVREVPKDSTNYLKLSDNPNILKGIYTTPDKWTPASQFYPKERKRIKIYIKDNATYFDNGADRPMDALRGEGNGFWKALYNQILDEANITKDEVMDNINARILFESMMYDKLIRAGVDIMQNGGEAIILNPDAVERVE